MPLLLSKHPFPGATFAVWQIAEEEAFFRADLPLSAEEEAEFAQLKGLRQLEWLAGRWLLHNVSGEAQRLPLAKTAFSKPFFLDRPDLFCSLSHSHGIVGALLSDVNGGCDLQLLVDKMPKIAPKFLSTGESHFIEKHAPQQQFDLMHLIWTAKESLYKAWGLKEIDFRTDLHVQAFEWNGSEGASVGTVRKGDHKQVYRLCFEKRELPEENGGAFVWTVCMPSSPLGTV
jgi:4'-phosphopantetheinyl transferase